jgi:diguanylate cyclase (GGDEF)-like protein
MAVRSWSRQEILSLITGREVWTTRTPFILRSPGEGPTMPATPAPRDTPIPAWIERSASVVRGDDFDWLDHMRRLHPADRGAAARAGWEAGERPGEIVEVTLRVDQGNGTHQRMHMQLLNLFHDEELACILCVFADASTSADEELEERTTDFLAEAPAFLILTVDDDACIVRADGMVEHFYGRTHDELQTRSAMQFLNTSCHDAAVDSWLAAYDDPTGLPRVTLCFEHPDGTAVWASCMVMNRMAEDGTMLYACQDITDLLQSEAARREQEQALRESQEQFRALADGLPEAVFRIDVTGRVEYGNARWQELVADFGTVRNIHDIIHPSERDALKVALLALASPYGSDTADLEVRSRCGERVFSVSCQVVGPRAAGQHTIIGSIQDVTSTSQLRHRADHDTVTGGLNRAALDRWLEQAIAEGGPLLVVFLDLDGFKAVNDCHGHAAGDLVLRTVAERVQHAVRPSDVVGRFGGDEFVVVCPGAGEGSEPGICGRIESALAQPVALDGGYWVPRASIGTARPRPGEHATDVLRRADTRMYEMKRDRQADDLTRL